MGVEEVNGGIGEKTVCNGYTRMGTQFNPLESNKLDVPMRPCNPALEK